MRPLRFVVMGMLLWGVICGYGSALVHLTVGHPGCVHPVTAPGTP